MATPAALLSPLSIGMLLLAVCSVAAAIAAGRRRRRRWIRESERLKQADDDARREQIERVRRELRASDFMSGAVRRIYYLVTLLSAAALTALPLLALDPAHEKLAKLGLTSTSFVGALALLAYWRGSSDELEGALRKRLRQAQERAHARRGLAVRDSLTGAYTLDFWLHVQELRTRRFVWRPRPVSCLMFDLEGLPELRARRGQEAGDDLLQRVAHEIGRNVRSRDLVARYRGQRFVIALDRCPAELGVRVAQRLHHNLERLILQATNNWEGSSLHLEWSVAAIPADAATPIQLLRVTETTLDVKKSLISTEKHEPRAPAGRPA